MAVYLAAAAVAGLAWWLTRGDITDDFASAFNAGDYEAAVDLIHDDSLRLWGGVTEWLMATGANDLRFEDCDLVEPTAQQSCETTFGEDWIYNRASDQPITAEITFEEVDGKLSIIIWREPDTLSELDTELSRWVEASHPDRVEEMWSFSATMWTARAVKRG